MQWKTIHLMLILEVIFGIKSNQGYVTVDFICAYFDKQEMSTFRFKEVFIRSKKMEGTRY